MIKVIDLYWLAGLYEGEGHFCYSKSGSPRMQLKMTDEDIIARARSLIYSDAKIFIKQHENPKFKTSYTIAIHGMLAIQWMMTLYILMGRRRKEQIREVISTWKLVERRQKGATHCQSGHPLLLEGTDYTLKTNKTGNPTRDCRICRSILNKEYKETYDRPSRNFNMVKTIAKLHKISIGEAEKFLDSSSKKSTIQ